jgi:DinB family protein
VIDGTKEIAWRQLGAALDMLERAIESCPDVLWNRSSKQMGFWYIAYHTLWFVEFDFSLASDTFHSPAFDVHEYELREQAPPYEYPYSKADVSDYLNRCRGLCKRSIASLPEFDRTSRGYHRKNVSFLEMVLGQIRHVQHHAAQLNLLLRQEVNDAPLWINRASDHL